MDAVVDASKSQYTVDDEADDESLEGQKVSPSLSRFKFRNFDCDFGKT